MTSAATLRVTPDTIYFRELAVGQKDTVDFWITNVSKAPRRIRCTVPVQSPFILSNEGTFLLAPGLDTKMSISYTAQNTKSFSGDVTIRYVGGTIKLPVKVTPPSSHILTDIQDISIGDVGVGMDKKFSFTLSNVGILEGKFTIECKTDGVMIDPEQGTVKPHESIEIAGTYRPQRSGDFEFSVRVIAPGNSEPIAPVSVRGNAVNEEIVLQVGDDIIEDLDFTTVFFHQKRVIKAKITNKGINKRSFVIVPPQGTPIPQSARSAMTSFTTATAASADSDLTFECLPMEGTLAPNESQNIDFVFTPPVKDINPVSDLETIYTQFSTIELVESGTRQDFQLIGKACLHKVTFSDVDFDFGKVELNSKTVKKLVITNESQYLPTEFEIKPVAQFRFVPEKGVIEPEKTKEISIIFYPRSFGQFELTVFVRFCNGLFKKKINLIAECGDTSGKPFKRIPIYETNPDVMYNVTHPDKRYSYNVEEIKENEAKRKKFDAYLTDMAQHRAQTRAQSRLMARTRRQARTALTGTARDYTKEDVDEYVKNQLVKMQEDMDRVDLSLQHCEGMTPPDPPLRKKEQPLVLLHPEKFGVEKKPQKRCQTSFAFSRKIKTDENVLIRKKFKPVPSTPQEISECNRSLTPSQNMGIVASHETISFGKVSVFSTVCKSFTITNNLQQYILVSLQYGFEELCESTPSSQVIPPRSVAGFDIKFCSKKSMNFVKTISYTVNGHATHSVNISAHVVPIDLSLSRNIIEFRFSPDSVSPIIKEFVTLSNKSIGQARFSWAGMTPTFTLSTTEGVVEPNRVQNIEITYTPTDHPHDEAILTCNVFGGESQILKCIGDVGLPKCSLTKKVLSFGLIPIGIKKTQTLRIKNSGEDDAMFEINKENAAELQVSPFVGRIAAHDFQTLTVSLKSTRARYLEIPVSVSIAGAAPLAFSVTGQSEYPQVVMHKSEFDFGKMFVGSSAAIEASVSNTGRIPAILYLDLTQHPEFRLEFASELGEEGDNDNANSITQVSDQVFVTKSELVQVSQSPSESSVNSDLNTSTSTAAGNQTQQDSNSGLIYKFHIVDGTTVSFNLVFEPTEVGEHSFEFPFTMMNSNTSNFHLQPIVTAEAVASPLLVSVSSMDFGIAPLFDPLNPHSREVARQVHLTNDNEKELQWSFVREHEFFNDPSVFSFEEHSGKLAPGESKTLHVYFTPRDARVYYHLLPISVEIDNSSTVVAKIQLTGVGVNCPYSLSMTDVAMPIVPLNVKSKARVFIINSAFIESEIRAIMPVEEKHFPLEVTFPDGNKMSHTTGELPVDLIFCSEKPLSFSTRVAFLDDHGNAMTISVSCTADNSIFTLYPFFKDRDYELHAGDGKPITLDLDSCDTVSDLAGRFASTSDYIKLSKDLQNWKPAVDKIHIHFIQRYLNAVVMYSQRSSFPSDFIKDDNALLLELIGNMADCKKPNLEPTGDVFKEDPLLKKLETMKNLIRYLEGLGALLSEIRPEFLLSKADFILFMRAKVQRQLLGIDRYGAPDISTFDQDALTEFSASKAISEASSQRIVALESLYPALSIESWMLLMMQLFKIFIMSKIDNDRLNKATGVPQALKILKTQVTEKDLLAEILRPPKSVSTSNVFSTPECVILKWISMHRACFAPGPESVVTSFESLNDSVCLGSLVKAHLPNLGLLLQENPVDRSQRHDNAIALANTLRQLKLGFSPRAEELLNGNCVMMAITSAYLFENLPHFMASMVLDFDVELHKSLQKTVSITNPSKAEVKYTVNLEAGPNYSVESEFLVVGPDETVEFPVQFTALSLKPSTGKLTLAPSRPKWTSATVSSRGEESARAVPMMPIFGSPIVVDLVSTVKLTGPDARYTIEGVVYEATRLEMKLKNFIGVPSTVRLVTKVTCLVDEFGKPVPEENTLIQQMIDLGNNPIDEFLNTSTEISWGSAISKHKPFLFDKKSIRFETPESEASLSVEFCPIRVGEFRCLMLFIDESKGEFFVELIARSNLPPSTEVAAGKIKTQAGSPFEYGISLDTVNPSLIRALAYAAEKEATMENSISDRKFHDMMVRRQRDLEVMYKQTFMQQTFAVESSSPEFFEIGSEVTLSKPGTASVVGKLRSKINTLPIRFIPTRAGDYPCKVVLVSLFDVRVITFKGIGLTATKELNLEFTTIVGHPVHQEVPVENSSSEQTWNFKITVSGDQTFKVPAKLSLKPGTSSTLAINFAPMKVGEYKGELCIFNLVKECSTIYKLHAIVEEPPAERKVVVSCKARKKEKFTLDVESSMIRKGTVAVTTTIPIISFPSEIQFDGGKPVEPFEYTVFAQRSGVSAGTITFTDTISRNYVWYVIEIHVDSPTPEEVIKVSTMARSCVTVNIPIANPSDKEVEFTVSLSDDDMFGEKTHVVPAKESADYKLVISPLKTAKRVSSVVFYNDIDGEFWYCLNVEVLDADPNVLAPISSPIGKYTSTFIHFENPIDKTVNFRITNDNQTAFNVLSKEFITLEPLEKRKIEVKYIPTALGEKENCTIKFQSPEIGDWTYKITGTGKPPQPLAPVLVTASVMSTRSAMVMFTNPFPYPSKFSIAMQSDSDEDNFKFLSKRKVFTLNNYGDEFQIPFIFTPKKQGQFNANIVVASLGPAKAPLPSLNSMPGVKWAFPVLGSSLVGDANDQKVLRCKAHTVVNQNLTVALIGEKDVFQFHEYTVSFTPPKGYDFVNSILTMKPTDLKKDENEKKPSQLTITCTMRPKRPLSMTIPVSVKNPIGQDWLFQVDLRFERGEPMSNIVIHSLLNKTGTEKVRITDKLEMTVPYHAYFVHGSATEFSVTPEHGFMGPLDPSDGKDELPMTVSFSPKMYGKIFKGLLVVDTLEAQFIFEVEGKTPDYNPPLVEDGSSTQRLDNVLSSEDRSRMRAKKRNIIKDNIEGAKIARPVLSPHPRRY